MGSLDKNVTRGLKSYIHYRFRTCNKNIHLIDGDPISDMDNGTSYDFKGGNVTQILVGLDGQN